jgi:protein-L-isoaspartate(D-aspartate) O-methyltransferase
VQALAKAARAAGVRDQRVLDALAAVPRARYVPPEHVDEVDLDRPIPIPGGQVTTQPSLVAAMVEALGLQSSDRVLEIGTGLGYQAAVLARLAGEVWTVERRPELAEVARANLEGAARVVVGDGSLGLPEHAPFDAIIVAAAYPTVPPPLAEQLAPDGRLVQPIGPSGAEDVILFRRDAAGRLVRERSITRAYFVALHGRYGFKD